MAYQQSIHAMDPRINPAGVEASMRLQYGTLNHLPEGVFREEIKIARACEEQKPGYLRSVAASFGMLKEFEDWDRRFRLRDEYVERIGYDPFADDPTISPDEVERILAEHRAAAEGVS